MQVEYISFSDRSVRSRYIADRFQPYLNGRVLDVGCDQAVLKRLRPDLQYTGIDVQGKPDLEINLEKVPALPFADRAFDCVVCSDVLEHLDNMHHVFGELVRVTRRHLIISLPNCWSVARVPIERGRGTFGHYGLPIDPPRDRHKWFFSLAEAEAFLRGQTGKYPITLLKLLVSEKPRPFLIRGVRRLRYLTQGRYLNRYAHTLWALFERTENASHG
ncbi:MAG: methyltransferase domain-containing protein [Nitrospirae bacterium]|nr:methyltransferase domain-containing protein [Nitrospirota bacterium]